MSDNKYYVNCVESLKICPAMGILTGAGRRYSPWALSVPSH